MNNSPYLVAPEKVEEYFRLWIEHCLKLKNSGVESTEINARSTRRSKKRSGDSVDATSMIINDNNGAVAAPQSVQAVNSTPASNALRAAAVATSPGDRSGQLELESGAPPAHKIIKQEVLPEPDDVIPFEEFREHVPNQDVAVSNASSKQIIGKSASKQSSVLALSSPAEPTATSTPRSAKKTNGSGNSTPIVIPDSPNNNSIRPSSCLDLPQKSLGTAKPVPLTTTKPQMNARPDSLNVTAQKLQIQRTFNTMITPTSVQAANSLPNNVLNQAPKVLPQHHVGLSSTSSAQQQNSLQKMTSQFFQEQLMLLQSSNDVLVSGEG